MEVIEGDETELTQKIADAEVGYWIARLYWNRGICSETLKMLIEIMRLNNPIF